MIRIRTHSLARILAVRRRYQAGSSYQQRLSAQHAAGSSDTAATTHQRRHFVRTRSSLSTMADYETRAKDYGFASKSEIQAVSVTKSPVIWMDVRTLAEIEADGRVYPVNEFQTWIHVPDCSPDDCPSLRNNPEQYLGSTIATEESAHSQTPPPTLVLYCKSGRRAHTARQILRQHKAYDGWTILNAGGYVDIANL
jgi:rhodanese-related sulfurtransferase